MAVPAAVQSAMSRAANGRSGRKAEMTYSMKQLSRLSSAVPPAPTFYLHGKFRSVLPASHPLPVIALLAIIAP